MSRPAALTLAALCLGAVVLAGCQPVAPPVPPAPPSAKTPSSKTSTVPPASVSAAAAAAIKVLEEKRSILASAPSVVNYEFMPESLVHPPTTLKDAAQSTAQKTGHPFWIPDPAVVGQASAIADRSLVAGKGGARKHGFAAVYPDRELLYGASLVSEYPTSTLTPPTNPSDFGPEPSRYVPGQVAPRWSKVTIRGNPGFARTRGPAEQGAGSRQPDPSILQWVESGVRYELLSWVQDPDQLLVIANTMQQVKP